MNTSNSPAVAVSDSLDKSIFERFWSAKGADCLEIVSLMSQKEPWALDNDLGRRLEVFAEALTLGGDNLIGAIEKEEFVQLQAWLSSEKALMIASLFDEFNPTLMVETLEMAGSSVGISEPFRLFLERIITFSRARLMSDLFNIDRVRRIEKLARAANK